MRNHELPLVSVIITTYQNEAYLPRAIESVLHQSYPNIELIVVDDNPPDSGARRRTEEVMARYPQAVYLRHPENRNGAAARNTGIRAAGGTYLAFLDNDDFYFSDHIACCVKALQDNPECKAVVCAVVKICGGLCWDLVPAPEGDLVKALLFRETTLGTGSNLFVFADAVRGINGFDERFRRHQDVEFGLRYFACNKAYSLSRVQIIKEMDGFSNMPNFRRFLETKQLLWETFRKELEALSPDEQKQYYAGQYSALLYTACKTGNRQDIDWTLGELGKYRPISCKERVVVMLSRRGMFWAYESLKKKIKYIQSPRTKKRVLQGMSAYDRSVLERALSDGKKE